MKRLLLLPIIGLLLVLMGGCHTPSDSDIVATTLPVYEMTQYLCRDTGLSVARLITEQVSCLHDYSLKVSHMKMIESAQVIVVSGGGLEAFLEDAIGENQRIIDASTGISLHEEGSHHHDADDQDADAHIWLDPQNGKTMANNICLGLCDLYPEYASAFQNNADALQKEFDAVIEYAEKQLSDLSCRELITFHDGFGYMADAFDLDILHAIEEEAGSEAPASELIELCDLVESHKLPAIFTEKNGSASAASVISAETGCRVYTLDMAISGNGYFDALYYNIDTLKEALE